MGPPVWPVPLVHLALAFALATATADGMIFPVLIVRVTVGFALYGLFRRFPLPASSRSSFLPAGLPRLFRSRHTSRPTR